jgi:N-methylhydantoinase A
MLRVGIDTGGTFTDLVAFWPGGSSTAKVPSTPDDPVRALLEAIDAASLDPAEIDVLVVGTTLGTNALLERRGARVAYLATAGFEDVPFIQRGNRPAQYDLHWQKPRPFIERERSFGVPERVDHDGAVVSELDVERLDEILDEVAQLEVDAVAVAFLFAYVAPEHEKAAGERVRERLPGVAVSLSHEVAPVWREYERSVTTIADAYLKPLLGRFVESLGAELESRGFRGRTSFLKSNGGLQLDREAARRPVELSLSGLAGGVTGGLRAAPLGADVVTFDMGGTSCDLAIVPGGVPKLAAGYEPEFGLPLIFPTIDVGTIGAGGGSVAWVDDGGFLRVGPRSAGAEPGPAAYGRGGAEPTLTDANLVLGRLNPRYFLGGALPLDEGAARASLEPLAQALGISVEAAALAVVRVAIDNMAAAIRERTVERGLDVRRYTLVAFGGAGPLHACALARVLAIERVLVPPHPGLCSAFGAATAEPRSDRVATGYFRSDSLDVDAVAALVARLSAAASLELEGEGWRGEAEVTTRLGLRYIGQNYEHEVEAVGGDLDRSALQTAFADFEQLHDRFYGYNLRGQPIELVEVAVSARASSQAPSVLLDPVNGHAPMPGRQRVTLAGGTVEAAVLRRASLAVGDSLEGPTLVEESDSTVLLEPGDRANVLADRTLAIDVACTKEAA